jgi:hypothetical protein
VRLNEKWKVKGWAGGTTGVPVTRRCQPGGEAMAVGMKEKKCSREADLRCGKTVTTGLGIAEVGVGKEERRRRGTLYNPTAQVSRAEGDYRFSSDRSGVTRKGRLLILI